MKSIILGSALAVLTACNSQQTQKPEVHPVIDSVAIRHRQYLQDSINLITQKENAKWLKTKAGKLQTKHPTWSRSDCEGVAHKNLWIGMHIDMVYEIYGLPDDINTSNYGRGNEYQFCWHDWDPGFFYTKSDYIVRSYN